MKPADPHLTHVAYTSHTNALLLLLSRKKSRSVKVRKAEFDKAAAGMKLLITPIDDDTYRVSLLPNDLPEHTPGVIYAEDE